MLTAKKPDRVYSRVTTESVSARVQVTGVSKNFEAVAAVAPTDLTIEPGEIVTLLGPSGCGKTTLLRLVAGLIEPTAGAITIDDQAPFAVRAAKRIGFVPQAPALADGPRQCLAPPRPQPKEGSRCSIGVSR
ncbi:MAG: ABC-type sugar transport system ATPase subunit [Candidatus Aldehydirespiratoraceae bacterium]|jgi:ABC-type sugar transport system ATPase subunit